MHVGGEYIVALAIAIHWKGKGGIAVNKQGYKVHAAAILAAALVGCHTPAAAPPLVAPQSMFVPEKKAPMLRRAKHDSVIRARLERALKQALGADMSRIRVRVMHGNATLRGDVKDDATRRKAHRIAEAALGSRPVANLLRVVGRAFIDR